MSDPAASASVAFSAEPLVAAGRPRLRAEDLYHLPRHRLAEVLASGHPIDPAALAGAAYRGVSLGLPPLVERLSWKTFQKTFLRDPSSGELWGWNVQAARRSPVDLWSVCSAPEDGVPAAAADSGCAHD